MTQVKASVYFSAGRMVLIAPHLSSAPHQHAVIQLTFSLDNIPFSIWTPQDGWRQTTAVVIDAQVQHGLTDFQGWQVSLAIMPEATTGQLLKRSVLDGLAVRYLDDMDLEPFRAMFAPLRDMVLPCTDVLAVADRLYGHLTGEQGFRGPLDARIVQVIRYIQDNIINSISAAQLARQVYLSEDRFLHLFKEQLGLPLRQYIQWQRVTVATSLFAGGMSLKEAAAEAGFSDAAHFSRVFMQMNGVAPSAYTQLRSHYQIQFCLPF